MSALVEAARKYKGVRFRHRGRTAYSLDCAGLPWRAYADLGVVLPDVKIYGRDPSADEQSLPDRVTEALGPVVKVAPVALSDLQVGDVVIRKYEIYPHHIMIVGNAPYAGAMTALHACGLEGRVVEHRLDERHAAEITHVFRRPV